jgi:hypothetical protein
VANDKMAFKLIFSPGNDSITNGNSSGQLDYGDCKSAIILDAEEKTITTLNET